MRECDLLRKLSDYAHLLPCQDCANIELFSFHLLRLSENRYLFRVEPTIELSARLQGLRNRDGSFVELSPKQSDIQANQLSQLYEAYDFLPLYDALAQDDWIVRGLHADLTENSLLLEFVGPGTLDVTMYIVSPYHEYHFWFHESPEVGDSEEEVRLQHWSIYEACRGQQLRRLYQRKYFTSEEMSDVERADYMYRPELLEVWCQTAGLALRRKFLETLPEFTRLELTRWVALHRFAMLAGKELLHSEPFPQVLLDRCRHST